MRKITSRWVPYALSEKNKADRVQICIENLNKFKNKTWRLGDVVAGDESWFYWRQIGSKQSNKSWVGEGEPARTIVRRDRFEPKTMVSIMFRMNGILQVTFCEKGATITAESYIEDCLKPLVRTIKKKRPSMGAKTLKFHHDNARPHVAQSVVEEQEFTIMRHPPYSPDLAPSDFWLFDYIKKRLTDHTSAQSLANEITQICESIPENELKKRSNTGLREWSVA